MADFKGSYSVRLADKSKQVYRQELVDANERKLVKQIEKASAKAVDAGYRNAKLRLVAVRNKSKPVRALLEAKGRSGT